MGVERNFSPAEKAPRCERVKLPLDAAIGEFIRFGRVFSTFAFDTGDLLPGECFILLGYDDSAVHAPVVNEENIRHAIDPTVTRVVTLDRPTGELYVYCNATHEGSRLIIFGIEGDSLPALTSGGGAAANVAITAPKDGADLRVKIEAIAAAVLPLATSATIAALDAALTSPNGGLIVGPASVSPTTQDVVPVTDAGQSVLAANAGRIGGVIQLLSGDPVRLSFGAGAAFADCSVVLQNVGDSFDLERFGNVIPDEVFAICNTGLSAEVGVTELG